MMRRFEELFRQDFWLKVLAVSLAILFWAMVVADYNKETTVLFDVLLEVKPHPTLEVFEGRENLDTRVEVRVTGPSLLVNSLTDQDLRAWVDYGRVTETGRSQDVEVQVAGPARIGEQVRYRAIPSTVPVTLVENRTVEVPIQVTPETGIVQLGNREFRYSARPASKTLPMEGRVDYLNYVRWGLVSLTDQDLIPPLAAGNGPLKEKSTTIRKPIQPVDSTGKKVEKLTQYYTDVIVTWEELPPGKAVQVQPRTRGVLPPGFELINLTVEPGVVTLRSGTIDGALPDLSLVETESVDLTGQTKTFTTAARIIVPEGSNAAVTSVNVTVTIGEAKVEKVFGAIPVGIRGQSALADVNLMTSAVKVQLTGPYMVMQPIDASAIEVYVDLEGLGEGRHRVPVKVKYPPGLLEIAVDPAIIEVEITNR